MYAEMASSNDMFKKKTKNITMLFACEQKSTQIKKYMLLKYLHTCWGCGRGDPARALNELQTADKSPDGSVSLSEH